MNTALKTDPNFHEAGRRFFRDFSPGDEFYEHLIDAHNGLSDEQSEALNARLILHRRFEGVAGGAGEGSGKRLRRVL
ncbi:MAG: hypothetical protein RLZZ329_1121 [Pseudomonadota bacterium]